MFICDPCRQAGYENDASLLHSYGPCELCGKTATCSDIPSGALQPRHTQTFAMLEPTTEIGNEPTLEVVKVEEELVMRIDPRTVKLKDSREYSRDGGGDPLLSALLFAGPGALIGAQMVVDIKNDGELLLVEGGGDDDNEGEAD